MSDSFDDGVTNWDAFWFTAAIVVLVLPLAAVALTVIIAMELVIPKQKADTPVAHGLR